MSPPRLFLLVPLMVLNFGLGLFFIEDALFVNGNADMKEFYFGLVFVFFGASVSVSILTIRSVFSASTTMLLSILSVVLALVYINVTYARWLSHEPVSTVTEKERMIPGHNTENQQWLMFRVSLLQRPARWYETAVKVRYLNEKSNNAETIHLPLKFVSRANLKNPDDIVLPPPDVN